ncbi:class I SAM-dependent methyltransferase [Amycolatopsis sp. H20-H5]|uniref:class I SAM-dependent methyltransferase n=1 Tax=Amycolatopsis sp. H20-H5 TaxID=3046309 RepID=UPI002DBC45D8|nr:class I SAM-dependent methyltransferase [Amycolatopsis sp. H20-H5]MEC3982198.1 class I SAM-dependent methyltransferase [Amycolatopsis sp. H20-H5]
MNEHTEDPHRRARRAASFGAKASDYAKHRPDYPESALTWGISGGLPETGRVLDLGAGTGKLAEGLVTLGHQVTAVEPDAEMLAELSRRLPGVTALSGTAEKIPLSDAAVDAVFVGQAFHWFDPLPAMTEIARVLRPGGTLVLLWNYDDETVPWIVEFTRLHRATVGQSMAGGGSLPEHSAFEPFEHETFKHAQRRTAETLVATISTHSHLLVASPEAREKALQSARDFLTARPETASGEFDLPLVTYAFRTPRTA